MRRLELAMVRVLENKSRDAIVYVWQGDAPKAYKSGRDQILLLS
jgi:hypothetical protein